MSGISRRAFFKQAGLFTALGLVSPRLLVKNLGQMPQSGSGIVPAAVTAYQLQSPRYALLMDLDESTYVARFTQLANQGYRSIWVQGAANGSGAATYSAIWVRDSVGEPWQQFINMTAADYQTKFTNFAGQGYRPISVSGYQSFGSNLFAATWLHDPSTAYAGIHNATNAQYQTFVNNNSATLRPQVVDGYAVGVSPSASDYYISIFSQAGSGPWEARHGLTSAQYQTFFNTFAPQGYHVTDLSAYAINGTTYFAAYMVKDGVTDWFGRHDTTPASLYNQAVSGAQQDYQPIVIESYDTGSTRNFAGVWIKKPRVWTTSGTYNANLSSFDTTMQQFMQARNIPGGTLAVTRNSRLVYARGYRWDAASGIDPVNPESLFRIASLTKPLTSMAVMRLVQEGKLSLSAKLVNLLSLPVPSDPRTNNITVLNLLQHQGGWNRDTTFDPMFIDATIASTLGKSLPISQQDIITYMTAHHGLEFTPGTAYNYSNYGYLLLGRIIEQVSGMTYANYMQTHVFAPLAINRLKLGSSEFEFRQAGEVPYFSFDFGLYSNVRRAGGPANATVPYGLFNLENMDSHGAWLSTALDLARFACAFDATSGYPVLTKPTIDQIFSVPAIGMQPDGSWYGCGWAVRTAGSGLNTWHNGSLPGTSTLMVRRNDGLNWVVLFNQRDDSSGLNYGDIDGALHTAANAVVNWPGGDLFPSYGLPGFGNHIYLPNVMH